jgi:hypothetical protein
VIGCQSTRPRALRQVCNCPCYSMLDIGRVYRDETGSRASDASPALDSVRLTSHLSLITSHSVSRPHRFLDHQMIHNELAAGGSVFAHIELQERLDHVAVVD